MVTMKNYKCIKKEKNMHHNPVTPLRGQLVVDNDENKNYDFHLSHPVTKSVTFSFLNAFTLKTPLQIGNN